MYYIHKSYFHNETELRDRFLKSHVDIILMGCTASLGEVNVIYILVKYERQ